MLHVDSQRQDSSIATAFDTRDLNSFGIEPLSNVTIYSNARVSTVSIPRW